MKAKIASSQAAAALFAVLASSAFALTVPVAQDTYSTGSDTLTPAEGAAATLTVSGTDVALVRFNLSDPAVVPAAFQPGNITSATLRLYITHVSTAGNLTVHAVTTDWSEKPAGKSAARPTIGTAPLATIQAADVIAKTFVTVNLTSQVIASLTAGGNDFGFAIEADAPTKVTLASKEGPATGYAAELDIEANLGESNTGGVDVTGTLTVASTLTAGAGNLDVTSSLAVGTALTASAGAGTVNVGGTFTVGSMFVVDPSPNNNPATANSNTFAGQGAGIVNTMGTGNIFLGYQAGTANQTGNGNVFIGLLAGATNVADSFNVFLGATAGDGSTGGSNNFVGYGAGASNSGTNNNYFGVNTGNVPSQSGFNCFFGDSAGQNNSGSNNDYFGANAGNAVSSGSYNSFFGNNAGENNTADNNVFMGANAGALNTSGTFNTFMGTDAGEDNVGSSGNTFLGSFAGQSNTSGQDNTFVGVSTGATVVGQSNITVLGANSNAAGNIVNATAIGANAIVAVSNSLVLGSINNINGATADTSVGIGTAAPNSYLQVNGTFSLPVRYTNAVLAGLSTQDYTLVNQFNAAVIGLPDAIGIQGRIYVIKNLANSATLGLLTGTETIDGAATVAMTKNQIVYVQSDGSNWIRLN